jgi:hypothetical protein
MKTGTTYLQSLFDANRKGLREAGLLWLPSRMNHQASWDFAGSSRLGAEGVGAWLRYRDTVRQHPGDVLFSSELVASYGPTRVERMIEALGADETHVIITARDLTKVVPSHWQETTQNQGTTEWREWLDRVCQGPQERGPGFRFWNNHYLPDVIRNWRGHNARRRVTIVTVPTSKADPALLWHRFASVIGVDLPTINEGRSGNPALGAISAELMRRVNVATAELSFPEYSFGFKQTLAKRALVPRAGQEPRITLTSDDYAQLRKIAIAIVDEVKALEVEVVGDLADLIPDETVADDVADPSDVTDADLLDAAIAGLASLGTRLGAQRDEIKNLKRSRELAHDRRGGGAVVSTMSSRKDSGQPRWKSILQSSKRRLRGAVARVRR